MTLSGLHLYRIYRYGPCACAFFNTTFAHYSFQIEYNSCVFIFLLVGVVLDICWLISQGTTLPRWVSVDTLIVLEGFLLYISL